MESVLIPVSVRIVVYSDGVGELFFVGKIHLVSEVMW